MKRGRFDLSDTDTDTDTADSDQLKLSDTDTADSEEMSGNSVVMWDQDLEKLLLREMIMVRKRKGIYSYVRNWEVGWGLLVSRLQRTPEFPDSLTKEQLVDRILGFIIPGFDSKKKERPTTEYEGLVYDVFHDHELCSPLQAISHVPPLSPPPTSSGSALTSEEAVEKCQAIIRCYSPYLSHGENKAFEIALAMNKYCDKIIAEQTCMEKEEFIAFLRETAEDLPIVGMSEHGKAVANAEGITSCSEVPETEVTETANLE